ncbi:hypothetical protein L1987_52869 [Smallanthus sonchifolius]|uniref:Uncharacterized protein n=1 Tax=Smallanthus sonchifolius TaxID=185202 RepID=A0ACB9EUA8_9ASTR|nr:hypothetical protein L1987_52869 [Smallanthus sonchifolius]
MKAEDIIEEKNEEPNREIYAQSESNEEEKRRNYALFMGNNWHVSASHNPGGPQYEWGIKEVFDFSLIKSLVSQSDLSTFDAMHVVIRCLCNVNICKQAGASLDSICKGAPLEDFEQSPDPNLTYPKDLVNIMYRDNGPDSGAASDGDGDRNMILCRHFFVTLNSVAIIAANAQESIP